MKNLYLLLLAVFMVSCENLDQGFGLSIGGTLRDKTWVVTAPNVKNGNIAFNHDGTLLCKDAFIINAEMPTKYAINEEKRQLSLRYADGNESIYEVQKYLPSTVTLKFRAVNGEIETVVLSH